MISSSVAPFEVRRFLLEKGKQRGIYESEEKGKAVWIAFIALFIIAGLVLMYTGNDAVVLAVRQKEGILTAE